MRDLREEMDYLREENRQLKALLVAEKHEFYELGLTNLQRKMLAVLMAESPKPLTSQRLFDRIWLDNQDVNNKIGDVVLFKLREKLKKHDVKIYSIWNVGKYIDAENRDKILQAVEAIRARGGKIELQYKRRAAS